MEGFRDRRDAGRRLGRLLEPVAAVARRRGRTPVVLGLPRGGVIVAAEVARVLGAPLDVILVRKLGLPVAPEVAMGAIAEGGIRYIDTDLVARLGVSGSELARVESAEREALERRGAVLRPVRRMLSLEGAEAIVVDDGIATGATARVACHAARARGAARVVLAAPVAAREALDSIDADQVISPLTPDPFGAVGRYYGDFGETTDDDVIRALTDAGAQRHRPGPGAPSPTGV